MAYLGSFDANTVEPSDRSALPAGDYPVLISNSEWKDSKAGAQYLALTLQVLDGDHKGRYLWHNLNLNHSNQQAADIAQRELSAICRATGQMTINDSEQLHNIPLVVRVAYVHPKDGYAEKNQIKQWKPAGSAAAPTSAPAPQAAARTVRQAPPAATAPVAAPKPAPTPSPAAAPKAPPAAVAGKPWAKPAEAVAATADDIDEDLAF